MLIMCICVCVRGRVCAYECSIQRGQKRTLEPLKLELELVVSLLVEVLRTELLAVCALKLLSCLSRPRL